jgi:3-oxoacyl-[acyl-carrier protein] reductase
MNLSAPHNAAPPLALISGGTGALGREIAAQLRQQGWQVHALGRLDMDLRDEAAVASQVEALPRLDLLVHCAGVLRDAPLQRMSDAQFDEVLAVHLDGAARLMRAALKKMLPQRSGHLLAVASWAARHGRAGQANYAAAKAGLIGLMQSLALEYGKRGIRSNSVLPGFLETPMTQNLLQDKATRAALLDQHALGRFNTVQDAARFVVFLQSMAHVSGQVFSLDSRVARWV